MLVSACRAKLERLVEQAVFRPITELHIRHQSSLSLAHQEEGGNIEEAACRVIAQLAFAGRIRIHDGGCLLLIV